MDHRFEIQIFLAARRGYDAVDLDDGVPMLSHFNSVFDLQAFFLTRGAEVSDVLEAMSELAEGKHVTVLGHKRG